MSPFDTQVTRLNPCGAAMVIAAMVMCAAGCQTPPPAAAPSAPPETPERPCPAFDVNNVRPAETVKAAALLPLRPGTTVYQMTDPAPTGAEGDALLKPVPRNASITRGDNDTWLQTIEGLGVTHYQAAPDGAVRIVGDDDENEHVMVRYDPFLLALPADLAMGHLVSGRAVMIVRNLDGSERERGTCDYTIELLGTQTIDTPAGLRNAFIVRATRAIDLQLAKVQVTIDTAYAPGVGMVAERVDQRIRALGLFPLHKSYQLTRLTP